MKPGRTVLLALLGCLISGAALAHGEPERNTTRAVYAGKITNIPGKSLKVVEVLYNPGASAGSHTHAKSAFIYAYVLEGEVRSQVAGQPVRVYQVGEYWTEEPGAHHLISENASKTKPARLLATFVVDDEDAPLTVPDRK
ncbi:cupin domain-containing protein [Pseudorhodoferax sp.]|uniref:cupin domain-containing protein n=1 Tax=Pseudorhodoferax sp. TaxID=1993553 RepID=UPI002DD654AA|nr:cupin domain-containing protein [Pseudorhodoferax sp.]